MARERTFSFSDNSAKSRVEVHAAGVDTAKTPALETFDLLSLPATIRDRLALAGLRTVLQQRTSDINAGPDKLRGMRAMFDYWAATGNWERPREGFTGNRVPAWLLAAIQAAKPDLTPARALASIEKAARDADKETWAALLAKYEPFRAKDSEQEAVDL